MTTRHRQLLSASSSNHQGEWSKGRNIEQLTNAVIRRIPYCSQTDLKNFVAHADKHDLDYTQDNLHNLAPRFHFYILWKEKNPKISELVDPFGFFGSPEFFGKKRQNAVSDILTDMKDDKLDMVLKSINDLQTQITQISSCLNQLSADLAVHSFKQQQSQPETQPSPQAQPSAVFTNCFEDNWDIGQINQ